MVVDIGSEGTYDTVHAFGPAVIIDGSTYKMWYSGYNGSNHRIIYCTSTDGINWSNHQMVVDIGSEGTYDTTRAHYPSVIAIDNSKSYRLYYSGRDASGGMRVIHTWYLAENNNLISPSQSVFDNNYLMSSEMADDPSVSAPQIIDSTANRYDGTAYGGMTAGDVVTGLVGKALDFDGNDRISFGNLGGFPSAGTIEIIFNSGSIIDSRNIFTTSYNGGDNAIRLEQSTTGDLSVIIGNGINSTSHSFGLILAFTDYYVTISWDTIGNTISGRLNNVGKFIGAAHAYWPSTLTDMNAGTGYDTSSTRQYIGNISLLRMSIEGERSATWIKIQYHSYFDILLIYPTDEEPEPEPVECIIVTGTTIIVDESETIVIESAPETVLVIQDPEFIVIEHGQRGKDGVLLEDSLMIAYYMAVVL